MELPDSAGNEGEVSARFGVRCRIGGDPLWLSHTARSRYISSSPAPLRVRAFEAFSE